MQEKKEDNSQEARIIVEQLEPCEYSNRLGKLDEAIKKIQAEATKEIFSTPEYKELKKQAVALHKLSDSNSRRHDEVNFDKLISVIQQKIMECVTIAKQRKYVFRKGSDSQAVYSFGKRGICLKPDYQIRVTEPIREIGKLIIAVRDMEDIIIRKIEDKMIKEKMKEVFYYLKKIDAKALSQEDRTSEIKINVNKIIKLTDNFVNVDTKTYFVKEISIENGSWGQKVIIRYMDDDTLKDVKLEDGKIVNYLPKDIIGNKKPIKYTWTPEAQQIVRTQDDAEDKETCPYNYFELVGNSSDEVDELHSAEPLLHYEMLKRYSSQAIEMVKTEIKARKKEKDTKQEVYDKLNKLLSEFLVAEMI